MTETIRTAECENPYTVHCLSQCKRAGMRLNRIELNTSCTVHRTTKQHIECNSSEDSTQCIPAVDYPDLSLSTDCGDCTSRRRNPQIQLWCIPRKNRGRLRVPQSTPTNAGPHEHNPVDLGRCRQRPMLQKKPLNTHKEPHATAPSAAHFGRDCTKK